MKRLFTVFFLLAFTGIQFIGSVASAAEKTSTTNEGLLDRWRVVKTEIIVNSRGEKKQILLQIRSPEVAFERRDPMYDKLMMMVKEGVYVLKEDRYDMHEYVKTTEKPVKPGTVVYYMLDPKPVWGDKDVILDFNGDKVQINNPETGQLVWVDKPRALKQTYLDANYKKIEEIRFMPKPGDVLIYSE